MAWRDDDPMRILLARRAEDTGGLVWGLSLAGLAGVWVLAGLGQAPLTASLWPLWSEAALALLLALAASLLLALPLDRARKDADVLLALRRGGCLPEVLATPLRPAEVVDGLAVHGLGRTMRHGLPVALALLLAGPALPEALGTAAAASAAVWLAALAAGLLASTYTLQLGVAWARPGGGLQARGGAWLFLALLPLAAALSAPGGLAVSLPLAILAMVAVAREGAVDGVSRLVTGEPDPGPPRRRPRRAGSWGEGNPLLALRPVLEGSGPGAWVRRHGLFAALVLLPLALAWDDPALAFWGSLMVMLPLQTWRAACDAFQAMAREAPAARLLTLQLTGLTAPEFALGLARLGWGPRLLEVAVAAPLVAAAGLGAGLPWPTIPGFLAALAGLVVGAAHLGFLAGTGREGEASWRDLALSYAALLGGVVLVVGQVTVDVMAGEWRYAVPRPQAILVILSVYLPTLAWGAAALLRGRSVQALAHRGDRVGFTV